ncbi:MAG TPA: dethiobiotin synthase, partial [Gemmataceae bacterium]|nr:dethiobiotin synthase [Gemmataceae bacterium]
MNDFVVVGTDTDAGKTTFCCQWLTLFGDRSAYWKPVETGPSDSETVRRLVPDAKVHPPLARFRDAVAPELAAQREGRVVPTVAEIVAAVPPSPVVIETFGSPLSPLADGVLQAELIALFNRPIVLVASSAVGAVGRTLQAVAGLREHGLRPIAIVLLGPADEYPAGRIEAFTGVFVRSVIAPSSWDTYGVRSAAEQNVQPFNELGEIVCPGEAASGARLLPSQSAAQPSPTSYPALAQRDRATV